ncbi:hypothetical protein [Microbacterium kribbense]|uniref:hypothetical protein n=1 Tax=Microbacterium kribbense TaxID=433645 RepID=UPI0031D013E4
MNGEFAGYVAGHGAGFLVHDGTGHRVAFRSTLGAARAALAEVTASAGSDAPVTRPFAARAAAPKAARPRRHRARVLR